ncbi:Leucine-rich repeat [Trinorchestia longiramus]|nr:Leucine-rich repeat [Trinorchestia longiramus]
MAVTLHGVLWVCSFAVLMSCGASQGDSCSVVPSRQRMGFYNITCACKQSLLQVIDNVDSLTIDRSECQSRIALDISWKGLEEGIGPRSIFFIGAQILLMPPPPQPWKSSISRIKFERCIFEYLPQDAFAGLTNLTELRFVNNYIGNISSKSIFNLPNLVTIEFSGNDIFEINSMAIGSLPRLTELAFVNSNIKNVRKNALFNLKTPGLPTNSDCPEIDIRISSPRDERMMNDVMGRHLETVENLPLPEIGARLHFYHNNISLMEQFAITSDMFSFMIFYGNNVSYLANGAFQLEMSNQCEISAAMVVGNYFSNVRPGALAFVQGRPGNSHAIYFVMTNNTFEHVADKGFLFHPSINVYSLADNKFVCNCTFFQWLRRPANTTRQQKFETDLRTSATCDYNSISIETFTSSCTYADFTPTFIPTETPIADDGSYTTEYVVVTLPDGKPMVSSAATFTVPLRKNIIMCFAMMVMKFLIR